MLSAAKHEAIMPLPSEGALATARTKMIAHLPQDGLGADLIKQHLTNDISPALSLSSQSSTYYGFVTGGTTEAARFADHMAVDYDQNVQVHLPKETVATDVEDCALKMLCELVGLKSTVWLHRTFTTGATASNVMGLAVGISDVLCRTGYMQGKPMRQSNSVSELGLYRAMQQVDVETFQVLTTAAHSSLRKAASIVGLGRAAIIDVGRKDAPHRFDFEMLEDLISRPRTASIVAVSCAEVNTGFFATTGDDMRRLWELTRQHSAWLHVDGAFGLLACTLPSAEQYAYLLDGVANLDLADSITGDAHKLVNVPYDCGFFLSKSLMRATNIFKNPNAAYLATSPAASIPSPLNIGIENSRRFRALPVYATLSAYGRTGYSDMVERQVQLARAIAQYIMSSDSYELLPSIDLEREQRLRMIYMVVLFRAKDAKLNQELVQKINSTRRIYVSGTAWDGQPAARFAVANWQADVQQDFPIIEEVLDGLTA